MVAGLSGCGGEKRRGPVGGLAYGMPRLAAPTFHRGRNPRSSPQDVEIVGTICANAKLGKAKLQQRGEMQECVKTAMALFKGE